jgi:hypothetical protein
VTIYTSIFYNLNLLVLLNVLKLEIHINLSFTYSDKILML